MTDALDLRELTLRAGERTLVGGVGLRVEAGQVVGLVGPSGSGKTLTLRACMGLVDLDPGVVHAALTISHEGRVYHPYRAGTRPGRALERAFRPLRGSVLGYLAQDARAALDPLQTVGRQVRTAARLAGDVDPDPLPWLQKAGLRHPERVARSHPHELSGGMAQRVCIAQLLARRSRFLLADEPTTHLDPTIQQALLARLRALAEQGIGVLLVTHDLRLLRGLAHRILVMDGGQLVESLTPEDIEVGRVHSAVGRELLAATRQLALPPLRGPE